MAEFECLTEAMNLVLIIERSSVFVTIALIFQKDTQTAELSKGPLYTVLAVPA